MTLDARDKALLDRARAVQPRAYAPYSNFRVGAAILTAGGETYVGVNVENASYPVGICAERSAIAAAVTAGDRDLAVCAIVTDAPVTVMPCGMCSQALFEFNPAMRVIAVGRDGLPKTLEVRDLLPHAYAGQGLARHDDGASPPGIAVVVEDTP